MHKRLAWLSVILVACILAGRSELQAAEKVPLRANLSAFHRTITTKSAETQKYFDQGLILYYGFNHDAAVASFDQAAALDPQCAMAYWGHAISVGPNINLPFMDSTQARAAWESLQKALKIADKVAPVERDLIHALASRYAWPPPEDRHALDSAYAAAMRGVWQKYNSDPDIGALFADAMMNLRPWNLFYPDGAPAPGTPEIMATLEKVISMVPDHPGANHFYVHTVEASPFPQLALPAANVLRNRIPGAGHLVHMPAHIDIRLGHYADAIKANQNGILADTAWVAQGGIYTIYRAHNYHFLAYAAMFDGQKNLAMKAARDMVATVPEDLVRAFPDFVESYLGAPEHVMVRFGMWNELLAEPQPPADFLATTAYWHYGRTLAFAALDRVSEASAEFDSLKAACARIPDSRLLGNNSVKSVLNIGLSMAEGELEYRRKQYDHAFELLRLAVQQDDSLHYDEPWGWMMPARHALGALLLEQNRLPEAEVVYREDLRQHPANGWALKGLAEVLRRTNREHDATVIDSEFSQVWARSDIKINASCFCRKGSKI
jgi:tetratricopeptide (TPR) repeat protein